ncbi:MAG: 30S ribosomal protein S24E, small subunit ribosomal protein S24e [archaeon GW2011_AR3]|nr:MAG: 30S ribosomal protein S24E, small subunit ribosomal protein S24e [archaeon GW2011_AR3]
MPSRSGKFSQGEKMTIKISQKKDSKVLDRVELSGEVTFTGAVPSREELRKKVASHEGVKDNLVVMKKISPSFGSGQASFVAYAYHNEEAMKKIEYEFMINRGRPKKEGEQKAEAKPAEQKAEAKA